MKFMKKLLSTMTAAAIGLSMTTALSVGTSVASAADKTAVQMVEDMGLGWNLGNALDSTNTWTSNPSPTRKSRRLASTPSGSLSPGGI